MGQADEQIRPAAQARDGGLRPVSQDELDRSTDPLDVFLRSFLKRGNPIGHVPQLGSVSYIDGVTSVLWYRKEEFQIQLFVVPPNHIVPEHTHPNVDSYEIYVGGQIRFSHSGRFLHDAGKLNAAGETGLPKLRGQYIRVRPTDKHGGVFGPAGGVFFSLQRWLNGVQPHCVSADYDGVVLGPQHLAGIVHGHGEIKTTLTVQDAASDELGPAWPSL